MFALVTRRASLPTWGFVSYTLSPQRSPNWPTRQDGDRNGKRKESLAKVAELADALDSGSSARKGVEVQVLSFALRLRRRFSDGVVVLY